MWEEHTIGKSQRKRARWPLAAAICAFIAAAIVVIESAMVILMAVSLMLTAVDVIQVMSIAIPLFMFAAGGFLLIFPGSYGRNALSGAALAICGAMAYVIYESYFSIFAFITGLEGVILLFPILGMTYAAMPAVLVTSAVTGAISAKNIFGKSDALSQPQLYQTPSQRTRSQAIAVLALFAACLIAFSVAYGYRLYENMRASSELDQMFLEIQQEQDAESSGLFSQTQFPSRGFELEESFDISKDNYGSGDEYSYFYRSKATGLSWELSESPLSEGRWHMAQMSAIFDEDAPLYGLDEFILVEEGGDYDFAYSCAHQSPEKETYVVLVDEIDKDLLDSYTEDYVNGIRQGRIEYPPAPQATSETRGQTQDNTSSGKNDGSLQTSNTASNSQGVSSKEDAYAQDAVSEIGDNARHRMEERGFSAEGAYLNTRGNVEWLYTGSDGQRWIVQFSSKGNGQWLASTYDFSPEKLVVLDSVEDVDEEQAKREGFTVVWTDRLDAEFLDHYYTSV